VSSVDTQMVPFFDLYRRGEVTAEQIDDFIGRWHDAPDTEHRSLSEYLGMTEEEYGLWVMDPETLPSLRKARATGQPLSEAMRDYVAALRVGARPSDGSAILAITNWLNSRLRDIA
jgi:hypothetical protein